MEAHTAHTLAMINDITTQISPTPHHHHPHHYHHLHDHHQTPLSLLPPPQSYPPSTGQETINTLFISGLPTDVKAREIHNLFRRRIGFDFCQLEYTGRGNQVVAFATFFNHQAAVAAMNALNGVTFDPQSGSTLRLHIELARSNSRSKNLRGAGAYFIVDKRIKASTGDLATTSNDGDDQPGEPSGNNNSASDKDNLATAESDEMKGDADNVGGVKKEPSEKAVVGEVQPCSTLFIANLGPTCTEEELKNALSQYAGFHLVKMRANRGMPVAFADFEDVDRATEAMQGLQESMLPSSDRGGMHLEYARSKMRKA